LKHFAATPSLKLYYSTTQVYLIELFELLGANSPIRDIPEAIELILSDPSRAISLSEETQTLYRRELKALRAVFSAHILAKSSRLEDQQTFDRICGLQLELGRIEEGLAMGAFSSDFEITQERLNFLDRALAVTSLKS